MDASKSSKAKKVQKKMATPRKLDFSSQSQQSPNQIQQIPQYPNQQYPQYPNQNFGNPNQVFSNQHFQYYNHQFPSQPQNSNLLSNPQIFSQNSYSHQPFGIPFTQSTPYTNMLTQPFPENDSQAPQNDPPIDDEVEVVEGVGVTLESRPYNEDEDICLARSWVAATDNARHGRDQSAQVWWDGITKSYNQEGAQQGLPKRGLRSLKNRFQRLKHDVQTYIEAEKQVGATYHSGWDQVKINDAIITAFKTKNHRYNNITFKSGHVLEILRDCSKFNYVTTRSSIPRNLSIGRESSPSTPNIGSNGSTEESREYHSGDKRSRCSGEEVSSPLKHPQRPIGNKAAKKGSRGKGKVGEASHMSGMEGLQLSDERNMRMQEELSQKREFSAERLRVYKEVAEAQILSAQTAARKLDVEERKLAARLHQIDTEQESKRQQIQMDRETKIMDIDANSIACDRRRAEVEAMQQKILAKWKNSL